MPTVSWFMAPPDETLSDNRTDKRTVSEPDNTAVPEAAVTDAVSEAQAVNAAAAVTAAAVSEAVGDAADSEGVDESAVSEAVDDDLVAKVRCTLHKLQCTHRVWSI
jgi:hypothetical protein